MTQAGRACTERDDLVIELQDHPAAPKIQVRPKPMLGSQSEKPRGSVVGHSVRESDLPVGDSAIDHFNSGSNRFYGALQVSHGALRILHSFAEDQCDLALHLGLQQFCRRDRPAILDPHIREQYAKIWLRHAQLRLHRLSSQTDLSTDYAPALLAPPLRIKLLNLVRANSIRGREAVTQWRDWADAVSRSQPLGECLIVS